MSQSSLPTREERKDGVNSNLGNVICTTEGGSLIQRRRSLTGQIFTSGSPQLTQKEKQQQKQPDFRCAHICLKFKKKKKASKRFFVKWIFCSFDCPMKKKILVSYHKKKMENPWKIQSIWIRCGETTETIDPHWILFFLVLWCHCADNLEISFTRVS